MAVLAEPQKRVFGKSCGKRPRLGNSFFELDVFAFSRQDFQNKYPVVSHAVTMLSDSTSEQCSRKLKIIFPPRLSCSICVFYFRHHHRLWFFIKKSNKSIDFMLKIIMLVSRWSEACPVSIPFLPGRPHLIFLYEFYEQ